MPNRQPAAAARNAWQLQRALARRHTVSEMRLAGVRDFDGMARQLGVSIRTIRRDFEALDVEYRERASAATETYKGQQHERIERAIRAIWPDVLQGRLGAVKVLVQLLDREAQLMGLDAPKTVRVDLEARIRAMAEREGFDAEEAVREAERIAREGY